MILSEMSVSRRYRKIARKCLHSDPDKRFPDIDSLEKALFAPYHSAMAIVATILILTAAAGWWLISHKQKSEKVDIETIDQIFREATDLLEDSDVNPVE